MCSVKTNVTEIKTKFEKLWRENTSALFPEISDCYRPITNYTLGQLLHRTLTTRRCLATCACPSRKSSLLRTRGLGSKTVKEREWYEFMIIRVILFQSVLLATFQRSTLSVAFHGFFGGKPQRLKHAQKILRRRWKKSGYLERYT